MFFKTKFLFQDRLQIFPTSDIIYECSLNTEVLYLLFQVSEVPSSYSKRATSINLTVSLSEEVVEKIEGHLDKIDLNSTYKRFVCFGAQWYRLNIHV